MKSTVLTGLLCLATGATLHAQFSFLPQVGFEQSRTTLNYNSLSASGVEGNLRASLKMDYRLKGGHGPYVNLGTSPAPVNFAFDNAGQLMKGIQQAENHLQFRMEAGYQYTSKAIQFGKRKSSVSTSTPEQITETATRKQSCGSATYKSHCSSKKKIAKTALANTNLNMRLQPSVGVAYLPSANEGLKQTANGFEYAANWKTALVPAMGFEFAKGKQRLFTLTVFYTQPLGMQDESFTTSTGTKAVVTNLAPTASTWGMTVGVPFSFAKAAASKPKTEKKEYTKTYYRRCVRVQ
jgi:hypothetical protein